MNNSSLKTKFTSSVWPLTLLAALIAGSALSGCVVDAHDSTTVSGQDISPATFAQIQSGQAPDFVANLLGQPMEKTATDGGSEIWRWHYTETHKNNNSVIFVVSSHDEKTVSKTHCVQFKDGAVVRAWIE